MPAATPRRPTSHHRRPPSALHLSRQVPGTSQLCFSSANVPSLSTVAVAARAGDGGSQRAPTHSSFRCASSVHPPLVRARVCGCVSREGGGKAARELVGDSGEKNECDTQRGKKGGLSLLCRPTRTPTQTHTDAYAYAKQERPQACQGTDTQHPPPCLKLGATRSCLQDQERRTGEGEGGSVVRTRGRRLRLGRGEGDGRGGGKEERQKERTSAKDTAGGKQRGREMQGRGLKRSRQGRSGGRGRREEKGHESRYRGRSNLGEGAGRGGTGGGGAAEDSNECGEIKHSPRVGRDVRGEAGC